jgi:hypothetical protein
VCSLKGGQPVISVDSKKKENLGNLKNNGREYHPKGQPQEVNVYDFPNKEKGKWSFFLLYQKKPGGQPFSLVSFIGFTTNKISKFWFFISSGS